jgi:hypothetical protein
VAAVSASAEHIVWKSELCDGIPLEADPREILSHPFSVCTRERLAWHGIEGLG